MEDRRDHEQDTLDHFPRLFPAHRLLLAASLLLLLSSNSIISEWLFFASEFATSSLIKIIREKWNIHWFCDNARVIRVLAHTASIQCRFALEINVPRLTILPAM